MSAHTVYEHAVDSLREVGQRVPVEVPTNIDWPDLEWPDDLVARVAEDLADGFGTVKTAVTPAAGAAAGAGAKVASSTGRFVRQHPILTAAGVGVVLALAIWMFRRSASSDAAIADDHANSVSQVA